MSRTSRILPTLAAVALGVTLAGSAAAGPSASIEQTRNGVATATSTPTPAWVTGNAGGSNSHYLESHSTPYRALLLGLPTNGTVIELTIGYNVKRSGSYAIDYLTHYQRVLPHVLFGHKNPEVFDPLSGVSGVSATVTTAPIPLPSVNLVVDPDGAQSEPAASQPSTSMATLPAAERVMTLFGGTLIDVTYVTQGDVSLATTSSEAQVKVRFTADSPNAVLAWGGHIACRWDWGFNSDGTPRSAGGISGSSYHMRLVTWNLGSVGNQDRSMSTDAVFPVPRCGISNLGPFCAGSVNTHSAPTGMESYRWTLDLNTTGAFIVGSDSGTSVAVNAGTGGSYRVLLTTGASGFTKPCEGTVTVMPPNTANAGADQTVCASSPQAQLAGQTSTGYGTWSGGAGSFNPSASALNAIYTPSASELTAGSVTLTLTCSSTAGTCPAAIDQVKITIQRAATANAGADLVVCASSPLAQLAGSVGGSAVGGTWSGGAGTFNPGANALNATYLPTAAEIAAGSVTLTLTTGASSGPCLPVSDAMNIVINPAATADAGQDRTVCSTSPQVQLAGAVGGGASSGTWSGGAGAYSPNASSLGATYTPSAAEIAAGGVTLTLTTNDPAGPCGAVNDAMRITISRAAVANAGPDQIVCSSSPQAQLAGTVSGGASAGSWSGGAGTFSPSASALNATYMPTTAEIAAGSVALTLTTDAVPGACPQVSDQMTITINPAATANAGQDRTVCSTSPQVQLAGAVGGGASSGTWSGGAGAYSPNASSLSATYTPSAAEIAAGGVTLTLTTNDPSGPCGAVNDQMRITINAGGIANAGPDQSVCSSSPQAQLAGSVGGGASAATWSGGAGSFSPSAGSLNATYTPTAAEIAAGSVTLRLTTAAVQGPCPQVSDQMTITINPAATANAGQDRTVCATSPQVQLAGAVGGGASGGLWSGGAGSFSPGIAALNATYTPSAAEIAAGTVTLTLTTNDPAGPCGAVSDAIRITINPAAVTNAGLDQAVCASSPQVHLQGSVSGGASGGTWSGGAGSFNPSASSLNATYTPSAAEIAAGSVTLTLTSAATGGPCPQTSDQMTIVISRAATVNAGPDQLACAYNITSLQLAGSIGGAAASGSWSGGAGSFSPNAGALNAAYTPTAGEIAAGSVTLTLTTDDPAGPCPAVSDAMRITFNKPTVTVSDVVNCTEITSARLCANPANGVAPYTYLWSTGATSSCITVSDTGSYAVTITDAKGCQATGSGVFRHRDCAGMLAHTNTTCQTFMAGTGQDFNDPSWSIRDCTISQVAPGVFFYYTLVVAPSPSFTVDIVQQKDNPDFPFIPTNQVQVTLYDVNCTTAGSGVETSIGQASVSISGATVGQVFVIGVKYSLKALVGVHMCPEDGCHYDFSTRVNGLTVDMDPDGLQIGVPRPPAGTGSGPDGNDEEARQLGDRDRGTGSTAGPNPAGGSGSDPDGDPGDGERQAGGSDDRGSGTGTGPVPTGATPAPGATGAGAQASSLDADQIERPMPNPFSNGMRMTYDVGANEARVNISVYDVSGRRVQTLASGFQSPGRHAVAWNGRDEQGSLVRKGMYFVRIEIGNRARQMRVTFLN